MLEYTNNIVFNYITKSGDTNEEIYTSSISAVSGYGNTPQLTNISDFFVANKPVMFSLSFDTSSWRLLIPVSPINVYKDDILSPYDINSVSRLAYNYKESNVYYTKSLTLATDKTKLNQSVYVSNKIKASSEFTSAFIYNLKLNCYRLFPNTEIKIKLYKDNTLVKIFEFTTGSVVYDSFIEMDLWDNNFANNYKFNYIILELSGYFEDIKSIGMMIRGLIR